MIGYKEHLERLSALYQLLEQTDYIDNKITEAFVFGGTDFMRSIINKYKGTLEQRESWRKEINELEKIIKLEKNNNPN